MKRWTAKRRQALVLRILRGETTAVEAARQHGLTVGEIEAWQEKAMVERNVLPMLSLFRISRLFR